MVKTSFCFDFIVVADEFIKALSFIKLLSDSDFLFLHFHRNRKTPIVVSLRKETDMS